MQAEPNSLGHTMEEKAGEAMLGRREISKSVSHCSPSGLWVLRLGENLLLLIS